MLRDSTEVESLSALQAKSVALDEQSFEALSVRNAQVSIRKTREDSMQILNRIDQLIDDLPLTIEDLTSFKESIECVSLQIHCLIEHCRRRGCDSSSPLLGFNTNVISSNNRRLSNDVAVYGLQLAKFVDEFSEQHNVNNGQIEITLRKMKEKLGEVIDTTIRKDCDVIINALRFPWGSICCKWALLALWQLTQNDSYICRIGVQSSCLIKQLLKLSTIGCGSNRNSLDPQLRASALRILTHLSNNVDATSQMFATEPGSNLITLLSFEQSELVLKEAVGLIVQVTMPLIDCKRDRNSSSSSSSSSTKVHHSTVQNTQCNELTSISSMNDLLVKVIPVKLLIKALTNLARVCDSKELFLLICASLANISFLEKDSFIDNETCNILLSCIKSRKEFTHDVPLKDQVITILANIASTYPLEVISCGGLVFLLSALEMRPTPVNEVTLNHSQPSKSHSNYKEESHEHGRPQIDEITAGEWLAIERIQQKVSAAMARLACNKSAASLLVRLNGVGRLVNLCRNASERNYSDTVLLASLAALRRIASATGIQPFKQLQAADLVQSTLRDSFFACSSQTESYV